MQRTLLAKLIGATLCMPLFLASCGNLPDMPRPRPPLHPSDGLTPDSYGPRTLNGGPTPNTDSIRFCDAGDPLKLRDFSRNLAARILSPLNSLAEDKIDARIKAWQLAKHFSLPADPAGGAMVTIVEGRQSGIVFWHLATVVPISEVANAAGDYCAGKSRKAVYLGTATKCGAPQKLPLVINGERRTSTPTFAISEFRCL